MIHSIFCISSVQSKSNIGTHPVLIYVYFHSTANLKTVSKGSIYSLKAITNKKKWKNGKREKSMPKCFSQPKKKNPKNHRLVWWVLPLIEPPPHKNYIKYIRSNIPFEFKSNQYKSNVCWVIFLSLLLSHSFFD